MKISRKSILGFVGPAVIFLLLIFLYPIIKTVVMSFFYMEDITLPSSEWRYNGFGNFKEVLNTPLFITSLVNMFKLIFICGIVAMFFAFLFAVAFTTDLKFKKFFRAIVYLPNVIASIAVGYMWVFYVFNSNFGLLTKVFTKLGIDRLASIQWLDPDHIFFSMCIAFLFGNIGYYMMMFIAGIEKIPVDYYEAATLEGCGVVRSFFKITLPLVMGVFSTALVLWVSGTMSFFALSQVFLGIQTYTPALYIYFTLFGSETTFSATNAGLAAAAAVLMTLIVLCLATLIQKLLKDKNYEL